MKWKDKLLKKLNSDFNNDSEWKAYIKKISTNFSKIGVHLAVFSEPILSELLSGNKTLESRMSINKIQPFGKVKENDIVFVKKSGGSVVAVFIAGKVSNFSNLTPSKIKKISYEYGEKLGLSVNDKFWKEKEYSKFATIIVVKNLKIITPYDIDKKDRTGWVILQERTENTIF